MTIRLQKIQKGADRWRSGWTLHSLRRLYRTTHAKIGTRREIAERLINHVSAVASDVEQIYDVYDYLPEMRKAVEQFEMHLAAALASQRAQAA